MRGRLGHTGAVDPTTGQLLTLQGLAADAYERLAPRRAMDRVARTLSPAAWEGRVKDRVRQAACAADGLPLPGSTREHLARVLPSGTCSGGNAVVLPPACTDALPLRRALIRSAKRLILVACAYVSIDTDANAVLGDLAEAARRGVTVAVMFDNFGADALTFAGPDMRYAGDGADAPDSFDTMMHNLRDAGAHLCFWRPVSCERGGAATAGLFDAKNHAKAFLVDGVVAIVTDRNIGSCYFRNPNYSSAEVVVTGPIVGGLMDAFWQLWVDGCGPLPPHVRSPTAGGSSPVGAMDALLQAAKREGLGASSAPLEVARDVWCAVLASSARTLASGMDPVLLALLTTIRGASVSVDLQFAYMVLCRPLVEELVQACKRGVRVRLVTNGESANDLWWIMDATNLSTLPVVEAGGTLVTAVCTPHHKGHVHAKVAVVDHRWVMVGSWNSWLRSTFYEAELDVLADCPQVAAQLTAQLDALLASPAYTAVAAADLRALLTARQPLNINAMRRALVSDCLS